MIIPEDFLDRLLPSLLKVPLLLCGTDSGVQCVINVCVCVCQMSLVDLGKRLLEAARKGQDDEVRNLMANGAPFTTDWVSLCAAHRLQLSLSPWRCCVCHPVTEGSV